MTTATQFDRQETEVVADRAPKPWSLLLFEAITVQGVDTSLAIRVTWKETSEPDGDKMPMDYVSIKFDDPEMDKPFNAALFDRDKSATPTG